MSFSNYTIDEYKKDITKVGMKKVWNQILEYRQENDNPVSILKTQNLGELYEIGLEHTNKTNKKQNGKYFTPEDVCILLSEFLQDLDGENICDVCCGTGNLILSFLNQIGYEESRNLILNGKLYLYDIDELAMSICKSSIGLIYGFDVVEKINYFTGDFLSREIMLPKDSKVLCNPPYYKILDIDDSWNVTDVIKDSKELYSAFIEKIVRNSKSSVIITPFTFIGSDKFYSLRKVLNNYNGMIFSFDNVPATIFSGRKHGVFNTNSANSVRTSIMVVQNKPNKQGFRISPLIRFQASERKKLLKKDILLSLIPESYQVVSDDKKKYYKCFTELTDIYNTWINNSDGVLNDLFVKDKTEYYLCVPTTCRYYLSATYRNLNRTGKNIFYFNSQKDMELAYCFLNSSFAYWHWRLFDGGILYPINLLKVLPIKKDMVEEQYRKLHELVMDAKEKETNYLVYKKNAFMVQENVKFPTELRDKFNTFILELFHIDADIRVFNKVHDNKVF